jgi:glutaredoxin
MRGKHMRVLIAVLISALAFPAAAQLYRWTDESGKTHFTDTPPPPKARNVQRKKPGTGGASSASSDSAGLPFALQQAIKAAPITLYTTGGCEACGEARRLLNERGIPFKEVSVASEAQLNELKNAVGTTSVPAMLVGPSVLKGFEQGQYHSALDGAGYPRSGILPQRSQAEPQPSDATSTASPEPQPASPARPAGPYAPR